MHKLFTLVVLFIFFANISQAQAPKGNSASKTNSTKPSEQQKKKSTVRASLSAFRGITWGTHLDSVFVNNQKASFIKTNDLGKKETNSYVMENEDLTIGSVVLSKIYYVFNYDSCLTKVLLLAPKNKFGEMKYIVAYKFGEPQFSDMDNGYQFYWDLDDCRISQIFVNDLDFFTVEFASDFNISNSKKVNREVEDF